jgi:hypothetical protein
MQKASGWMQKWNLPMPNCNFIVTVGFVLKAQYALVAAKEKRWEVLESVRARITDAICYIHGHAGMSHNAILKSDNIAVFVGGIISIPAGRPVLIDFGISS